LDLVRSEEEAMPGLPRCTEVAAGVVFEGHGEVDPPLEIVVDPLHHPDPPGKGQIEDIAPRPRPEPHPTPPPRLAPRHLRHLRPRRGGELPELIPRLTPNHHIPRFPIPRTNTARSSRKNH